MKALEILKRLQNSDYYDRSKLKLPKEYTLENAIAEIEEAMKPKTCDGCKKSWEPNNQTFHRYFCEYLQRPIHGNFYCNRYEPKEQ